MDKTWSYPRYVALPTLRTVLTHIEHFSLLSQLFVMDSTRLLNIQLIHTAENPIMHHMHATQPPSTTTPSRPPPFPQQGRLA